ncbi:MAG: fibronectin type III domain-containing protein, partial [Actinomycetota bacterium]|nr:fibronectin type III domain-containing protein [Actinomycetota bacterium]
AKARGVPVVSAEQMMTWLDGRNGSSFGAISYAGDVLSFRVSVGAGATALRGMVPATFGGKALTGMARNGTPITFTRETIKGVEYAFFPATSGDYTASYAPDTVPPAISAVAAVAAADGTATVTWTTDEASDSRVDYGTSPTALTQNQSDAAAVSAHSVRLTGLTPGTTYHYRVRSADGSGNAATAPSTPATFATPVTAFPATTTIETGTARAGTAASLTADDNVFFQVNSTTTGTRTTSWWGSFTGVPANLSNLRVTYAGRNSRSCTQVLAAWRWTDSTWQQLDSRAVANADVILADLVPPGAAGTYVSATGEVRVRVRCTATTNGFSSGDQMLIRYTRP